MFTSARRVCPVGIIGVMLLVLTTPASAGTDDAATAETAMAALSAALPGAIVVPGASGFADVPECDVATEAEGLATNDGESLQQNYSAGPTGVSARIVAFSSKSDAKRYYKLFTGDRARDCIEATVAALSPLGGDVETQSDLERGRVPGVRPSVTFEGTLTIGTAVIANYEAYARVGSVAIQVTAGGQDISTVRDTVEQWMVDTADSF